MESQKTHNSLCPEQFSKLLKPEEKYIAHSTFTEKGTGKTIIIRQSNDRKLKSVL